MSWRRFLRRKKWDEERARELEAYLQAETEENVARGMSTEEARRAAHVKLGNTTRIREEIYEMNSIGWLETLWQDVHYGMRMLRKNPGFTIVAVLTLALGIGANTAIFSLVDCLVLRPLPVERPGEVVLLTLARKGESPTTVFSYPDFTDIQRQTGDVFSDVSALGIFVTDGLAVNGQSRPMWSNYVTGNFFGLLGLKPALGRLILPSEGGVASADPVLVISYAYWRSRFNGDPSVIGKKASVNGVPVRIVGVAPEGFHGVTSLVDFQGYLPLGMGTALKDVPKDFLAARDKSEVGVIARLRSGVTLQQAQATLNVVARRLSQQYPATDDRMAFHVLHLGPATMATDPTNAEMLPFVSSVFLILAASVLVIACMNIANLFLVRSATRQREMAMRAALGATRTRLVRQLLTESILLALFGCGSGIILGLGGSRAFSSISLHTSLPIILDFRFDWRVFAYALAAAVLTGVLVGILPALRAARGDLNEILHEGGRTSTAGGYRLRSALVAAQVGGSLMLLIVAGLFVRSLEKAQHTDLGFDPNRVLDLTIDPHQAGYNEAQAREFFRTVVDRARALPGALSASIAASVPMAYGGGSVATIKIDGYQPPKGQGNPSAGYNAVSSRYFETMHITLLRGREILDSDSQDSQHVAVIDQTMANRYWRGQDPVGKRFSTTDDPSHPLEVVGVARNAVESQIFSPDEPFFYVPFSQFYQPVATLQLRSVTTPEAMARETAGLIHSLEPAMPVYDVQSMTAALDTLNGFLIFRFAAALAASLGILGLILAVVGVYGVISYAASQRTHEIGIRLALGAQPGQILQMIFRQGLFIVGAGVIAGVLAAAAMARLVGNLLFGVPPGDPLTYVAASALLAVVALLACYIPARRAMRVDPMVALRYE
ncbi:MAG TPA: ABC transporter permease [Candidatus Acidoferrales bacterium]|nr:ABC transporter permease [Candidatus Acidoferrales bacterium]